MIHSHILCIQIFTLELENIQGPPGPQLEISSEEAWKKHTYFRLKHTLFGRWEGGEVLSALTKKPTLCCFCLPGAPLYIPQIIGISVIWVFSIPCLSYFHLYLAHTARYIKIWGQPLHFSLSGEQRTDNRELALHVPRLPDLAWWE